MVARNMRLRRLLPEFRRGTRSISRVSDIGGGRAIRSTRDDINDFHASPTFAGNVATVSGLPGLFRRVVAPRGFGNVERRDVYTRTTNVWTYTDDPGKKLGEDILTCVQQPEDNNFLSTLTHSHDLAKAVLNALPSNRHALVEIKRHYPSGASPYRRWQIIRLLSRQDLQSSTKDISAFTLRVVIEGHPTEVGPCATFAGKASLLSNSTMELHLRPKALLPVATFGEFADKPTHSVDDFIRELLDDLWYSLRGCQFTSFVSWNEAVVTHLKDSFGRSKFDQYLDLESMKIITERQRTKSTHALQWIHESPRLEASLDGYSIGKLVLPHVLKLRHKGGPKGIENEAEAPMALGVEESYGNIRTVIHPYTLDISVVSNSETKLTPSAAASVFEKNHARNAARDLPSMLGSFLAVSKSIPTNITDPMTVKISRDAPTLSAYRASSSPYLTHSVELKKGIAPDSVKVHMHTDLQRSFQLRFNSKEWKDRRIQVKGILFQISPIDAAAIDSLLASHISEQINIEQEMSNLATNAANIVQKVCDGVKFDDVTTVTGYLAGAVLRVVRPLTEGFVLESVSMEVVIGDDLVTLTKTVSVADLAARARAPEYRTLPLDHVELPSGYQATVSQVLIDLPSEGVHNTGFPRLNMQLFSHPVADYDSTSVYGRTTDIFNHGLKAYQSIDFYALQATLCGAVKELTGKDEVIVQLTAPPPILPNRMSVTTLCQVTVFSDGEIVCVLEPIIIPSLTYERPRGLTSVRALVQITLRGTPNQQVSLHLNVRQQMALMEKLLASKYAAEFDGSVIGHPQLAADKIAEMTLEARSELEDHFDINTVSVHFGVWLKDNDQTGPAERHDAECEAESELSPPSENADHTRMPASSADSFMHKDVAAIKALLRELDSKLLSTTSTSSDDSIAADEVTRSMQLDLPAKGKGQMQRGVVVALGSNVGNRLEEIEKACRAIDADPDMRIVDTSFLYETKPMYVEDQGNFVNGACEIETSLTPIQLLDRLQAIEQGHGRVKLVDKGPRNIDLDIAIFRDEVVETERLTVPHMLMHEREFVLRPIMDLSAMRQWRNPRTKRTLPMMLKKINKSRDRAEETAEPMHAMTPLTADAMVYPTDPDRKTLVMSILNTTPDSFSDGESNTLDPQSLRKTAAAHIAAGATIIDVGGQSSRPNAPDVTAEEEINRVLPAIAAIKSLPEARGVAISVDTYRAAVAEAAVNAGAHIVNDISAGMLDPQMLSTVSRLGCTYIMMHMRGTPATMQSPENCTYEKNFRQSIVEELGSRVTLAVEAGVRRWRVILDPGIGFAKTQEHNIKLLRRSILGGKPQKLSSSEKGLYCMPKLVGCSRKGFIGNITGVAEPKDRIYGTAAAVTASIRGGADIVRVHDVQEMVQVAKMADAIYRFEGNEYASDDT